jgi:hypothetical protein
MTTKAMNETNLFYVETENVDGELTEIRSTERLLVDLFDTVMFLSACIHP